MIETAMTRAEARVCVGSDHCFALAHQLGDTLKTCTLKGRCKVRSTRKVIASRGGLEGFDVWLEVSAGLVKVIRQADARAAAQGVSGSGCPDLGVLLLWLEFSGNGEVKPLDV